METDEVKEISPKGCRHSSVGNCTRRGLAHTDKIHINSISLFVSTYTKVMLKGTSHCVLHCLVEYRNSEEFSMKIAAFQPQDCKIYCVNVVDFVFKILYSLI